MVKILYVKSARKVLQNKTDLEDKLNVKITVKGTDVSINGKEVDEHFAERVLLSMDFPFLVEDSLLLKNEDYLLEVINIKDYTKRQDLGIIKGRIIGTKGKTLKVLTNLTGCEIAVKDNNVAIIGRAEEIEAAINAVVSLIQGSKQANVYAHLEKLNKGKRTRD
tara:strand:- start:104 stop:595 length:492 start_codon:yes stop_codon:yes gene_type:complete